MFRQLDVRTFVLNRQMSGTAVSFQLLSQNNTDERQRPREEYKVARKISPY